MTTSPVSPVLSSQISQWRMKSNDGTITLEEMRLAIKALRSGRNAAAQASSSSRSSSKKPARAVDDMLGELEGL